MAVSVITCESCTRYVDTDFDPAFEFGDGHLCEACYDAEFEKQKAYWLPLYEGEKRAGLIGPKENCYGCATQRHSCEHDK